VVKRRLFDDFPMPERFSFEQDLVEPNIQRIRPRAFRSDAYFIDMGVPEDYERARREIGIA
jgi:D-glycero-alpha-D-manno-heptose 1-phosphate guanylyltransferase